MVRPLPLSRRRALVDMDPRTLVRVYTWQYPKGWDAALERGHLTGSHGSDETYGGDMDRYYEWMRSRMAERIPGFSGDLPVWAHLKGQNPRRIESIRNRVRIIAMVPRGRMLISDLQAWDMAIVDGPICENEAEYDAFPEDRDVTETWHRAFEIIDQPRHDGRWAKAPTDLQACVDRIALDEIVSVRHPDPRRAARAGRRKVGGPDS
jgi:hypothetical protein